VTREEVMTKRGHSCPEQASNSERPGHEFGRANIYAPVDNNVRAPAVAVIFRRLGPYHHARLNAAVARLPIRAIESCGLDDTYAWDRIEGAKLFSQKTLTPREQPGLRWRRILRARLCEELDESNPDVVAVPGWSTPEALTALEWCMRNDKPAVLMSESARQDEVRRPWKEWLKRRVVGLCSTALVGGRLHTDYLEELGMPRDRIFHGYDAVDNDYFGRQAQLPSAAQPQGRSAGFSLQAVRKVGRSAGFSLQRPASFPAEPAPISTSLDASCRLKPALRNYFLASARFVEKKNLPRLIEAYSRYRKGLTGEKGEDQEWDLVLLGDGEIRPALEAQVAVLNLRDHITMPGFKQYAELPAYYGSAGAFIHASTTEQWGLVVNEAMASGLPVLVSNRCGCVPDLVNEGINGFTFDPRDVEQLAELMRCMAEMEPARRAEMGLISRQQIAAWGPDRFAVGLQDAVQTAFRFPLRRPTLLDRFLLRALACR